MAIKIPPDAPIVTDKRLNLIRILSTFTAKNGRLDTLKRDVKGRMKIKEATFAQSELVVARLAATEPKSFADPRELYAMVKSKRITLDQFLGAICVRTSLLPAILSGAEIDAISKPATNASGDEPDGSLWTEFKPDVKLDFEAIEAAILDTAAQATGRA